MQKRQNNSKAIAFVVAFTIMVSIGMAVIESQPNCPKSEQKIIHVPAVKGETVMDSYEAYDYIVCEASHK